MPDLPVLIMGTAEWNAPIATNQHYVTKELAQEHDIVFVESIGLRAPKLNGQDLRRIAERLTGLLRPRDAAQSTRAETRPVPDRVTIVSPIVLPWHNALTYPINWALLRASIIKGTGSWNQEYAATWLYTPVNYGVVKWSNHTIYHCVDLLGQVEGISEHMISKAESALLPTADLVLATSKAVERHLKKLGARAVELVPNVADVDIFGAWTEQTVRNPTVVFGGALSEQKLDLDLIVKLADELTGDAKVLLVGPFGGSEAHQQRLRDLFEHPRIEYAGTLSLSELARTYRHASVGFMPYLINSYTKGISPLKTYEFLSAGLPVVSIDLPGIPNIEGHVTKVTTAEDFIAAVVAALETDNAEREACRYAAQPYGWVERGKILREKLSSLLTAKSPSVNV